MSVGWLAPAVQVYGGMHHQPARLVRAGAVATLAPDRLTNLEGLGTLGQLGDEPLGTDEGMEQDWDWVGLVKTIVGAAGRIAPGVIEAFRSKKIAQGYSVDDVAVMLGGARARAAQVQEGTAPMPTSGWIGIGVGVAAALALVLVLATRR